MSALLKAVTHENLHEMRASPLSADSVGASSSTQSVEETPDHLWAHRQTSKAVDVHAVDLVELLWGKPFVELPGFRGQPDGPEWSTLNLVFKPASLSVADLAHRPPPKSFTSSLIQGALAGMLLIGAAACGAGLYKWLYTAPMQTQTAWKIKSASTNHITIQMPLPPKRAATGQLESQTMEAACSLPCRLPDGSVATHLDPVRHVIVTNTGDVTPLSVIN